MLDPENEITKKRPKKHLAVHAGRKLSWYQRSETQEILTLEINMF